MRLSVCRQTVRNKKIFLTSQTQKILFRRIFIGLFTALASAPPAPARRLCGFFIENPAQYAGFFGIRTLLLGGNFFRNLAYSLSDKSEQIEFFWLRKRFGLYRRALVF